MSSVYGVSGLPSSPQCLANQGHKKRAAPSAPIAVTRGKDLNSYFEAAFKDVPDRWKCTHCHLLSRRCHTLVSSLCWVCACPCLKSTIVIRKGIFCNLSIYTCPYIESNGYRQCKLRRPRVGEREDSGASC